MNYRHTFHAGSAADVFKHVILVALIKALLRKDTAFLYLETHAGTGRYDLLSDASQKNKEFEEGIQKIVHAMHPPALIQDYLTCVNSLNQPDALRYYPGSPWFAHYFLRTEDRMVLAEWHPEEIIPLKKLFADDKRVGIHHQDGYQGLKAFLPPKERRGLVLIDPPYEKKDELMSLPALLGETIKRFETGVYAIWYPIKTSAQNKLFREALQAAIKRPFLITELCVHSDDVAGRLNGSGMVIINPPWQIDQQMESFLPWLWNVLTINRQGYFKSTGYNQT
ncbi:MAG TPA: 23S rRNA (adenine(2030)-N(6))-methyltransferase RlmJ [Gammaproteobacteria bacterium]|nr:23S rRNA (adenine(2030)-N(6))-methyltransferase RlmJ [Gammaproteobacteria bacterium]